MAGEKSDERRKCRSVVENLSPKDQRKPSIEHIAGKVERPSFKERAAVHLRVNRSKGERIRLLIGERHLATLKGSNNASEAQATAKVHDTLVPTFDSLFNVARECQRARPQMCPVRRLLGLVPQERLAVYPALQILHTQEGELSRADSQLDGFSVVVMDHNDNVILNEA